MTNNRKKDIRDRFNQVDSKESLIDLLNHIYFFFGKKHIHDFNEKKVFTSKQINYFLHQLAIEVEDDEHRLYDSWEIIKKSGGKRKIHAPQLVGDFKDLLHCIDWLIRAVYEPHINAYGFIESKNVADNARLHLGSAFVYNIDIKDFFHSFDLNRVKLSLFNSPFQLKGSKEPIAYLIASLSTCIIEGKRVLPQGSPVSPALTNHICYRLDRRLSALSKRFGVKYSRYADDITFSSNHNVFYGEFISELKRIIEREGLHINEKKTRLLKKGERQEVTGITINNGLNVSSKYVKQIRMYLYFIERYGIEKANEIYIQDLLKIKEKGEKFIKPNLENVLKGKLNYLSMVKGKDDPVYLKLVGRYNLLFEKKATKVDQAILYWRLLGIDKAREVYYEEKANEISDEIENGSLNTQLSIKNVETSETSSEPIYLKINNSDYRSLIIDYKFNLGLWQFKNSQEEREILAKRIVSLSIKQNKIIRDFISKIEENERELAEAFLLKEVKKNPFNYGSLWHFKLSKGPNNYYDAFLLFKSRK